MTTIFTLYPNLMFLSFASLFILNYSQSEFSKDMFGIDYLYEFSNNFNIKVTLLFFIGIYMVLIIIIVCSKLCSKCIHQRIKLYANIIIRDNFTALLFGTILFCMDIEEFLDIYQYNDVLYIFNFRYYFLILTLRQ